MLVEVVLLDEKAVADLRKMFRVVRQDHCDLLCFGCKSLVLQRYQFILKAYLLLGKANRLLLLDEAGARVNVTFARFICVDVPRFAWECVASAAELLLAFIRLEFLRHASRERQEHGA